MQLNSILDEHFEATLKLDPLFATSIGDHRYDAELPVSILPEHRKKEELLAESGLRKIRNFGCRDLPETDLLTCLTFEEEIQNQLALLKADLDDLAPFNQFWSFPSISRNLPPEQAMSRLKPSLTMKISCNVLSRCLRT